jgi:dipeptidyl aminopeptidase/acylaminoacyl peptidase
LTKPKVVPYGSWKSPITSELTSTGAVRFEQVLLDGDDVYWVEGRPAEGGRNVIVRRTPDGERTDMTPAPFNARTRVHEYGGAACAVFEDTLYFSNFTDQRLYRQAAGSAPQPITQAVELRYADGIIDPRRNRLICVREDHRDPQREAINTLVGVFLKGDEEGGKVLVSGNNFYSSPRLSPDGSRLAWLTWNHPNMPWDGCELWVANVKPDGSLINKQRIAGGLNESIFQPEWSPGNVLHFISDRTGWWNLYRWHQGKIEPLGAMQAEFGQPQWLFGMSKYAFESSERLICAYNERGTWRLASLDLSNRRLEPIETPYTEISFVRASPGRAVFLAGSPTELPSVVQLDLATGETEVLRRSSEIKVDRKYLSIPDAIEFSTENGLKAHAFYYAPKNDEFVGPRGDRPPLIVISHGGPTSATTGTLRLEIQYWTSRGFAIIDVNYGGSTGYGRAYRERLNGQWGVVDVDDCVNAARYLVERSLADKKRLIIRGGSAGGYTTLCALTFRDVFKAGASYFGIGDLEADLNETHKFESRYTFSLVGPYPEAKQLYRERSPIHYVDCLSCPIIFFQGLDDKIVLPDQAEMMVSALRAKDVPVAYLPFEGEGHGFRNAKNIKRTLEAELYFYSRVFGFKPAGRLKPVPIENL